MKTIIIQLVISISLLMANEPSTCDLLAADPISKNNPKGITGIDLWNIDGESAIKACTQAVKDFPNEPRYSYQLARAYRIDANFREAYNWYSRAAEQGSIRAMSGLGNMHQNGWHIVDADEDKAVYWYKKAADQGDPVAQDELGDIYHFENYMKKSRGEAYDYKTAQRLYMKASEQNFAHATMMLGSLFYEKGTAEDYQKALKLYMKASSQGNGRATAYIGDMYYDGTGVDKNFKTAREWYVKAAEQGSRHAASKLGDMYFYGYGVNIDFKKAFEWNIKYLVNFEFKDRYFKDKELKLDRNIVLKWLEKASESGNVSTQAFLGELFSSGSLGIKKDPKNAFEWYSKAAKEGELSAMRAMGDIYYNGTGVKKDYEEAFKWYKLTSDEGHSSDKKKLGDMYYYGKGVKKNYTKALELYLVAGRKTRYGCGCGDSNAQYRIGVMYDYGQGVKKDQKEAFKWYSRAAKQDNDMAQYNIAQMYIDGIGTDQDLKKGLKWLLKSAQQGNIYAPRHLGLMYKNGNGTKQDYKQALKWFKKSAQDYEKGSNWKNWIFKSSEGKNGDFYNLGLMYKHGNGIKQDYKKAFKWFMKSAKQGNKYSQYEIGVMYYYGQWATKNYKKAFKWFKKSAERGNQEAQYYVGAMYDLGKGVKKSHKKAFKWYMKLAEQGNADAQINIGLMYHRGHGVKKNYKKAFKWFMEVAKKNNSQAQSNVGVMYANGYGVKKSYIRAYAWYNLALSNGLDAALKGIKEIEPKMTKNQIAIAQEYNPLESKNKSKPQEDGIGTGFFVSKSKVLTNNHVINGCKDIELIRKGYSSTAKVIAKDVNNDLAILNVDTVNSTSLKFRTGRGLRIGNEIVVLGYPLGDLLGTSIKLTTGNVSSLTGLADDTTRLQMSAPVQPGNSGGPLLDTSGNIVGVVYARIEKSLSGRLTQNVNLAIKGNVAQMFLDINNVDYEIESSNDVKDLADIADEARESVVKVVCHQ